MRRYVSLVGAVVVLSPLIAGGQPTAASDEVVQAADAFLALLSPESHDFRCPLLQAFDCGPDRCDVLRELAAFRQVESGGFHGRLGFTEFDSGVGAGEVDLHEVPVACA